MAERRNRMQEAYERLKECEERERWAKRDNARLEAAMALMAARKKHLPRKDDD